MSEMREILFRGKYVSNGDWIYGVPVSNGYITCIFKLIDELSELKGFEVKPKTVGQYTGLTDKNGVKIFEGDVVHCIGGEFAQGYHEIDKNIVVKDITDGICVYLGEVETMESVGNIYDNPELLKGETK